MDNILWIVCYLLIFVRVLLFSVNESPYDQEDTLSWDTWFLDSDITYSCIDQYYDTADVWKEEEVVTMEKGTIESDYEDDKN